MTARLFVLALGFALSAAWAGRADAGSCSTDGNNIVANCGFESGAAPWTFGGDAGVDSTFPELVGSNDAYFGNGNVSQTLTLQAGETYSIVFGLAADSATTNDAGDFDLSLCGPDCIDPSVTVSFDGTTVDQIFGDDPRLSGNDYFDFSYTASASDNSGALLFSGTQDSPSTGETPGTWYLDEVYVDCTTCGTQSPVPEPDGLPMLLTAFAGWYSLRRMRRGD